jgi:hypothetical protein
VPRTLKNLGGIRAALLFGRDSQCSVTTAALRLAVMFSWSLTPLWGRPSFGLAVPDRMRGSVIADFFCCRRERTRQGLRFGS